MWRVFGLFVFFLLSLLSVCSLAFKKLVEVVKKGCLSL